MEILKFCEKYLLDARSYEEKHNRSMALAYERLLKGKTSQATRLFAYNHALNQQQNAQKAATNKPIIKASAKQKTTKTISKGVWKVRVWKKSKVIKTLTTDKDKEAYIKPKITALGLEWDKATIHDPKTMKTLSKFYNK